MDEIAKTKSRFETAKRKRQQIVDELHSAYFYTSPMGSPKYVADSPPDRTEQFDSTAEDAVNTLVTTIMSHLIPRDQAWIRLNLSERFKQFVPAHFTFEVLLEIEQAKFYEAINGSDFYKSVSEALKDCVISGTGAIGLRMAEDRTLLFYALPLAQLYYLDDGCGEIDTVFREHRLPVRTVIAKYSKVPDWIRRMHNEKPDEPVEVIECMFPGKKPGQYEWQVFTGKWEELDSQTVKYKPIIVFRWDRTTNSTWGDSPVCKALPDIRTLNLMMADLLDASAYAVCPPMQTNALELQDAKIEARKTYYSPNGQIKAIEMNGQRFDVGPQLVEMLKQSIRRMLMADVLPQSDRMTSAEVQVRQAEFFRRIGVYALRLEEELLEPIVRATIACLQNMNIMEKSIGGEAATYDDKVFTLETNSLNKRVEAQREVDRVTNMFMMASQLGPNGLRHINLPKTGRYLLERGGFPAALLNPEKEVEDAIKAEQAANVASGAMAAENGQATAESNQKLGEGAAALMPELMKRMPQG